MSIKWSILVICVLLIVSLTSQNINTINYPFEVVSESRLKILSVSSESPFIITNTQFSLPQNLTILVQANDTSYISTIVQQTIFANTLVRSQQVTINQYATKSVNYKFTVGLIFNYCYLKKQYDTYGVYTILLTFIDQKFRPGQVVADFKVNLKLDYCKYDQYACMQFPCPKILQLQEQDQQFVKTQII